IVMILVSLNPCPSTEFHSQISIQIRVSLNVGIQDLPIFHLAIVQPSDIRENIGIPAAVNIKMVTDLGHVIEGPSRPSLEKSTINLGTSSGPIPPGFDHGRFIR